MGRPYPLEFRRQMVALVRSGRTAYDLTARGSACQREIDPSHWVAQAEQEEGDREVLKPDERAELERLRRENRQLKLEREILSKAAAWFARETSGIKIEKILIREREPGRISDSHTIMPGPAISTSGYYAWAKRSAVAGCGGMRVLLAEIRMAHVASHGTYGAPRIQIDLAEKGFRVGRKRVARLMAAAGIVGVSYAASS